MPIIEVTDLHKRYGGTVAVEDVSFTVEQGEIFGILGPNGAGKTTTVESVVGLRAPDRGSITVLGLDPRRDRAELRQRVGVQLQESRLPDKLKVWRRWTCTARTTAGRRTGSGCSTHWAWPTSGTPGTGSCPAARSNGCRSCWRW